MVSEDELPLLSILCRMRPPCLDGVSSAQRLRGLHDSAAGKDWQRCQRPRSDEPPTFATRPDQISTTEK